MRRTTAIRRPAPARRVYAASWQPRSSAARASLQAATDLAFPGADGLAHDLRHPL